MRICKKCEKSFNVNDFPLAGVIKGKIYRRHVCKKCLIAQRTKRKRMLSRWRKEIKMQLKCEKCGIADYRVLDFHHNNNKRFDIANAAGGGFSKESTLTEIKKCNVLCANCHRIEHYKE
jgi:hypothetical protein